jgi:hypothetical protein
MGQSREVHDGSLGWATNCVQTRYVLPGDRESRIDSQLSVQMAQSNDLMLVILAYRRITWQSKASKRGKAEGRRLSSALIELNALDACTITWCSR